MEVTTEEYLKAIELIENYHSQINVKINNGKTKIEDWVYSLDEEPSGRLHNILLRSFYFEDGKPFKYVEDVNKKEFMRIRNAGKKAWNEFKNLRK